jgi:AraC-like DNA-binding protein
MTFALINTSLVFLFNYFYFQKDFQTYSYIHSLHIGTVLWIFPSIYLYVNSILTNRKGFNSALWHLLPGVLFMIVSAILFYGFLNNAERIYYLSNYRNTAIHFVAQNLQSVRIFRYIDVIFILSQIVYYSVSITISTNRYNEKLLNEFSNVENLSINWIKGFNYSFLVVGILFVCFYIFNPFKEQNTLLLLVILFGVSMFMWAMGIASFKQKQLSESQSEEIVGSVVVDASEVNTNNVELISRLIDFVEIKQAFLQSDISMTSVCRELGTNRTYLSALINQQFGVNFNTFINQYRVKHVTDYLKENPATTKDELVQLGGFGSMSSMIRAINKK